MGLAASQARLLTITSRKSSAQFESMRLSHQKLALSRSLTDVSNEYQDSLKQTKLFYDFYGIGSTDNMLSYSLFMTPSYINDYTPVLLTNRQNRIVLSSSFAAAARAAGIPQEGLDGYIDDATRDSFIDVLAHLGEIDPVTAQYVISTDYNPFVGLGQTTGIYTTTQTEGYESLERMLSRVNLRNYTGCSASDLASCLSENTSAITAYTLNTNGYYGNGNWMRADQVSDSDIIRLSDTTAQNFHSDGTASFGTGGTWNSLTLYDILYGSDIILTQNVQTDAEVTNALDPHQYDDMLNIVGNVIGVLADQLEDAYGLDDAVRMAINQANANMNGACWGNTNPTTLGVCTTYTNPEYDYYEHYTLSGSGNHMPIAQQYLAYNLDDLDVLQTPQYSYIDADDTTHFQWFATAEDYWDGSNRHYNSIGYEPYSYWVSMPSTVEYEYFSNGDQTEYWIGSLDTNYYSSDNINTARRNAVTYALLGARNNLALINMYDYMYSGNSTDPDSPSNQDISGNYGAINLSKFVQAWYTYFIQALATYKQSSAGDNTSLQQALSTLSNDTEIMFHHRNHDSSFVTNSRYADALAQITLERGTILVDDGIANIASFYDTIINQICEYGWTENDEVRQDAGYMQEMLKTGKMFLFKLANDSYYYQNNYSTDTFIKEVEDESAIAQAEAKYKTQKARINAKEQEIDIKMKNLDTEISSLETEYEAVKKMIANSQKVFQRYQS